VGIHEIFKFTKGSLYLKIFVTMVLVLYWEVGDGGGGSSSGSGGGKRGGGSCGCGGFLCVLKDWEINGQG
jgi:uncharacterized membrane protein YgcG